MEKIAKKLLTGLTLSENDRKELGSEMKFQTFKKSLVLLASEEEADKKEGFALLSDDFKGCYTAWPDMILSILCEKGIGTKIDRRRSFFHLERAAKRRLDCAISKMEQIGLEFLGRIISKN